MENFEWPQYVIIFGYFLKMSIYALTHGTKIDIKMNFLSGLVGTAFSIFVLYMGGFFS